MDFFETVEKRKSIRQYEEKPVDAKSIRKILDAVNLAPSAGNIQAYRVSLIRNQKARDELMLACMEQEFVARAPVVLVFSAHKKQAEIKYTERGFDLYSVQDATIAAAYAQLAATALGLSSVWVGGFEPLEVSRIIGADPDEVPVAVIPIGHPAEDPERPARKDLKKIVREI
jgi:nitroreductase